jgi:hypothetical protein
LKYIRDRNFLNSAPIAQEIGAKIDQWNYIKLKSFWGLVEWLRGKSTCLKSFCTSREPITRIYGQHTE